MVVTDRNKQDCIDFQEEFSDRERDLLRPAGRYVGIDEKHEDKRSEQENKRDLWPAASATQKVNIAAPEEDVADRLGRMSLEEVQSVQNSLSDQDHQDMPLGMDLDDFFPDENVNGEKSSVGDNVPAVFSKATMRTLRVRGVALEDLRSRKREPFDPSDLDEEDLLKSGDLVATLLHTEGKICLGILLVKGIRIGADKSIRSAVSLSDLEDPESKAKVIGQLLEMCNPQTEGDNPADYWEWTGNFLCLDIAAKQGRETRQLFVLDIPGILIHPLGPSVSKQSGSTNDLPTWSVSTAQLTETLEHAWLSLEPLGKDIAANVAQLPQVVNPDFLPYRDALGKISLVVENVPEHLTRTKLRAKDKISCLICGKEQRLNTMRHHVAKHILLSLRGVTEGGLQNPVGSEPCGFCGLDGCFTQLVNFKHPKKTSVYQVKLPLSLLRDELQGCKNCSKDFSIHECPNSLISGEPPTIWKYNAMYHIVAEHSLPNNNTLPPIPAHFMRELFIRKSEEDALGIPQAKTEAHRLRYQIPDSDAIDMLPGSDDLVEKRGRSNTESTGSELSDSDRHVSKKFHASL
ncbi:hypothetical protein B0H11DRAFT_1944117 [Mycena galericulata]|nr:hypothetical protein B0H11DRAFT_1944117 [Mycena galericulata]